MKSRLQRLILSMYFSLIATTIPCLIIHISALSIFISLYALNLLISPTIRPHSCSFLGVFMSKCVHFSSSGFLLSLLWLWLPTLGFLVGLGRRSSTAFSSGSISTLTSSFLFVSIAHSHADEFILFKSLFPLSVIHYFLLNFLMLVVFYTHHYLPFSHLRHVIIY